jgi:hypothetical protein
MDRYCLNCGYDLSATPIEDFGIGCCPECGRGFEDDNPYTYSTEPLPPSRVWVILAVIGALVGFAVVSQLWPF